MAFMTSLVLGCSPLLRSSPCGSAVSGIDSRRVGQPPCRAVAHHYSVRRHVVARYGGTRDTRQPPCRALDSRRVGARTAMAMRRVRHACMPTTRCAGSQARGSRYRFIAIGIAELATSQASQYP